MLATILTEPVSKFTIQKLITVSSNVFVNDAARIMTQNKTDSVLVFDDYDLIGIITIKDIISDVVAEDKDPTLITIKEITKGPLITIQKDAKVKDAISLMAKNNIRRIVVKDGKKPIGIITRKMIVGNLDEHDVPLAELENSDKVICPYCPSIFANSNTLSRHIDDIHIGRGLLEGNLSKVIS